VPSTRQYRLYFEDRVRAPDVVLRPPCDDLGIALEPAVLRPGMKGRRMHPDLGAPDFHARERLDGGKDPKSHTRDRWP
jgi:hypothetical protein